MYVHDTHCLLVCHTLLMFDVRVEWAIFVNDTHFFLCCVMVCHTLLMFDEDIQCRNISKHVSILIELYL